MEPADVYAGCRARLVELALRLDDGALHAPLAATPPWTVLDGFVVELGDEQRRATGGDAADHAV